MMAWFCRFPVKCLTPALALLAAMAAGPAASAGADAWIAGAYSYSDELGGFTITGISGTGSKSDPVVIRQEFNSATPVTLVIRAIRPIRALSGDDEFATGFIFMRIESLNNSGLAWVEFEFELQEIFQVPSVFGDGLSFDQRRVESENVSSDRFREYSRDFEPYDRLLFTRGHVDPFETAGFSFFISDFTPKRVFYLLQDPRVPSS